MAAFVSAFLLSAAPVPAAGDSANRPPEPPAFTKQIFATAREMPAPVSFTLGERGEVFTVNSGRFDGHGVFDNRRFPIVLGDATSTSVADRRRLTEQWVREDKLDTRQQKVTLEWLAGFSEQVRRLDDTDGDGRADPVTALPDRQKDPRPGARPGILPDG